MPQDTKTQHAYEQTDHMEKLAREEEQAEAALNDQILHSDQHTGQAGVLPTNEDAINGADAKAVYDLLPGWHRDELARLRVVPPGTRLKTGGVYFDLRNPARGELRANGEETVQDELLVPKRDVDYEIWDKLLSPETRDVTP